MNVLPSSLLLNKILTAVKEELLEYCATVYSRSGVIHMWICNTLNDLLENLKSQNLPKSIASKLTACLHFI